MACGVDCRPASLWHRRPYRDASTIGLREVPHSQNFGLLQLEDTYITRGARLAPQIQAKPEIGIVVLNTWQEQTLPIPRQTTREARTKDELWVTWSFLC